MNIFALNTMDLLLVCLFELVYVLVPGVITYRTFSKGSPILKIVTVGIPVGVSLCVLFFLISKMAGIRSVFLFYPVPFVAGTLYVLFRERTASFQGLKRMVASRFSALLIFLGISVVIGLLSYVIVWVRFPALPSLRPVWVDCTHDLIYFWSLAAELKHRWPPQFPFISGEPLNYHFFSYFHMAAVSSVTQVSLERIVLEIALWPCFFFLILQVVYLGRLVGGSWGTGFATAFLLFILRDVTPGPQSLSGGLAFLTNLVLSPSFLLGGIFFIALLIEVIFFLVVHRNEQTSPGNSLFHWRGALLLSLLFLGAAGAKSTVVPFIVGAAACTGGVLIWKAQRDLGKELIFFACLGAVVFFSVGSVLYESVQRLKFIPLHLMHSLTLFQKVAQEISFLRLQSLTIWYVLTYITVVVALVIWHWNYLAGIVVGWRHLRKISPVVIFLALLAGVNVVASLLLMEGGGGEVYFMLQAQMALAPLAGLGIFSLLARPWNRGSKYLYLLALGCSLSLVSVVWQTHHHVVEGMAQRRSDAIPPAHFVLDSGLYSAMVWLRDNTDPNAVILSNVSTIADACTSAVSERRQVLEMVKMSARWAAAGKRWESFYPYDGRYNLIQSFWKTGNLASLKEVVRDYGATHLFVDKKNGSLPVRIPPDAELVYENSSAQVYRMKDLDRSTNY